MIATFGSAMTNVTEADFVLTGCVGSSFVEVDASTYMLHLSLDGTATVQVFVGAASGNIFPPNAAALWDVTYTPFVSITVSDGLSNGDETSLLRVTITATFGSAVTGVTLGSVAVTGASTSNFAAVNATTYTMELELGALATVTVQVPRNTAGVSPPNAASSPFTLLYRPEVQFSLSDGLVDGSSTTLQRLTLTVSGGVCRFWGVLLTRVAAQGHIRYTCYRARHWRLADSGNGLWWTDRVWGPVRIGADKGV